MTDQTEARALIVRLADLAEKATPMSLGTAEIAECGYYSCPLCNGDGEVDGATYVNIDGVALNVQFSGIGSEFGDNERFVLALIEAYRSDFFSAALDDVELLADKLGLERALTDAAHRRAREAEAQLADARAEGRAEGLREAQDYLKAEADRAFDNGKHVERERIAMALDSEADVIPCEEDALVFRSCAKLVRADFSYEDAEGQP